MKIGILQTGLGPDVLVDEFGDYPDMFQVFLAGRGFTFETYRVLEGQFPDSIEACDGWLITGSKFGAYEDHAWIPPLEDFIRDVFTQKHPIVGVCFGHQIIAQALGGQVEKFKGGWKVGRQSYSTGDDQLTLNAYHQDQVITPPPSATRILGNEHCKNAVIYYGDTALTVQPHPEFSSDFVKALIDARGIGVIAPEILQSARDGLLPDVDAQKVADMFEAVLKGRKNS
ncbi:type 1 glutamine amidotransferase [Amylibacter marinus]|nr:type 1 glutamine amidotransferase [Amylibacter marinus]